MKVRVLYNKDDSVSVIHPVEKSRRLKESEADWLARVFAKATPGGIEHQDIDHTELPDRSKRYAWKGSKASGITIDNDKVKAHEDDILIEEEKVTILKQQAIDSLKEKGKK